MQINYKKRRINFNLPRIW